MSVMLSEFLHAWPTSRRPAVRELLATARSVQDVELRNRTYVVVIVDRLISGELAKHLPFVRKAYVARVRHLIESSLTYTDITCASDAGNAVLRIRIPECVVIPEARRIYENCRALTALAASCDAPSFEVALATDALWREHLLAEANRVLSVATPQFAQHYALVRSRSRPHVSLLP